ncbi:MAG: hypothetical protein ACYT04_49960 [Nostoc sp.]
MGTGTQFPALLNKSSPSLQPDNRAAKIGAIATVVNYAGTAKATARKRWKPRNAPPGSIPVDTFAPLFDG